MPVPPIIHALADDFTGAAEIAAIGFRHGLVSTVVTGGRIRHAASQLVVIDTDSRLESAAVASNLVARAAAALSAPALRGPLFKKTDSVLRGNVVAEIEALGAAAGRTRALLVPANPALGRTIRHGTYYVDGQPVAETAFAHDPHHPAKTSAVAALLGAPGRWPIHVLPPPASLPRTGLIVGEVTTGADVARWTDGIDPDTLPAGGGEFFATFLRHLGRQPVPLPPPPALAAPLLVVSGTTAPAGHTMNAQLAAAGVTVCPLPEFDGALALPSDYVAALSTSIAATLATRNVAVLTAPARLCPGAGDLIRTTLTTVVSALHSRGAFVHLVVEGGATAAAIARTLGWQELMVVAEFAQGVVTMQPGAASRDRLTIKPGSYPWPTGWCQRLAALLPPLSST